MSLKNDLSPSVEDYLETIYRLDQGNGVRSIDVATFLNVAKPSVNHALNTLVGNGLVSQERYGQIYLTIEGKRRAQSIFRSHSILKSFLIDILDVKEERAEDEACSIEHILSPDTIDRIEQLTADLKLKGK